jgi:hypothetical protein
MTSDDRLTWDFIREVLDVIERHGYHRGDNARTGQAIGLIGDVARIYEGTLDAPPGGYVVVPSSQPIAPQSPGPPSPQTVAVPATEVKTLLSALYVAADHKRDLAWACADCPDRSCPTCESLLQSADHYDQAADQVTQAAETSAIATTSDPEHVPDREAGQ